MNTQQFVQSKKRKEKKRKEKKRKEKKKQNKNKTKLKQNKKLFCYLLLVTNYTTTIHFYIKIYEFLPYTAFITEKSMIYKRHWRLKRMFSSFLFLLLVLFLFIGIGYGIDTRDIETNKKNLIKDNDDESILKKIKKSRAYKEKVKMMAKDRARAYAKNEKDLESLI